MLLFATWRTTNLDQREEWRFTTPLGNGYASLLERDGSGTLAVAVDITLNSRYIEPGRYCALGALAFIRLPEIRGTSMNLRLSAVPPTWVSYSDRVVSIFKGVGLRARITSRTLVVENEKLSPSLLLKRSALALYALDPFSKGCTPPEDFRALRLVAIKEFGDTGHDLFDLFDDVTGERSIRALLSPRPDSTVGRARETRQVLSGEIVPEIVTRLERTIRVEQDQWAKTFGAFSRWTVDPRWLIYLPPGMCSLQTDPITGPLEHPRSALDYYKHEGVTKIVVEFKHMGSRAIVVVCRDEEAAKRRFGPAGIGCIYTRNGRPFFEDDNEVLLSIRHGLTRARFWEKFQTDWVCLDGECLPWTLKAEHLIGRTHQQMLMSGEALLHEMEVAGSLVAPEEVSRLGKRRECFRRYRILLDRYLAEDGSPLHFAPFQLIATEGRVYFERNHKWHMEVLQALARSAGDPFIRTPYRFFSTDDHIAVEECSRWWDELSDSGSEGLVVKPLYCVPRGRRGFAQPAIKCRTPEHLRLVYGREYDLIENRWNLANRAAISRRREKHRRVLKQHALSIEGVERFVNGESTAAIEICVRALLSLEKR